MSRLDRVSIVLADGVYRWVRHRSPLPDVHSDRYPSKRDAVRGAMAGNVDTDWTFDPSVDRE